MVEVSKLFEKEEESNARLIHVDLTDKGHMVAENLTRKLHETNRTMMNLYLERMDQFQELEEEAIKAVEQYNELLDYGQNMDPEDDSGDIHAEIEEAKEVATLMVNRHREALEADGLLDWLRSFIGEREVINYIPLDIQSRRSKYTRIITSSITDGLKINRSSSFSGFLSIYNNYGVTNVRPAIINSKRLPDYLLLIHLFGKKKTSSKKANIILSKLMELERIGDNYQNRDDLRFFIEHHQVSDVRDNVSDYLHSFNSDNEYINNLLRDRNVSSIYSRRNRQGVPIGVGKPRKLEMTIYDFQEVANYVTQAIDTLKAETDYYKRIKIINNYVSSFSNWNLPVFGSNIDSRVVKCSPIFKNLLRLAMFGYENYLRLLDYFIEKEINVHTFWDNVTDGVLSRLWDPAEQEDFFKYLKRIGGKSPNQISRYMGFFGYKNVRKAKNLIEMDAYISKIEAAKRGHTSGKTGENELLLENVPGSQLVFFTKEEGEIITIGNRTGCCFTPSGLAKSLLKIARESNLAGILEGRHGTVRKSDWFAFTWELVEYNPVTNTIETALVLDNIESLNPIEESDWAEIYKWLLKTPYNKVYLGTQRNDIAKSILSNDADPRDLTDWHFSSKEKRRSRQIIYYEKEFNSYHYDDSKCVYTVFDRTDRVPKNISVARVTTKGEFNRVLYAEGLVWGSDSDYQSLRNLNFHQSPTYLTRDSAGNIYGYLITRLYKYNIDTATILWNDSLKVGPSNPLEENEDLVLYLDDVYSTKNTSSLEALSKAVDDLLGYAQANNIKYVSAHFNSYSKKFLKRIEAAGVTFLEDTRFNDTGTQSNLAAKSSKLLKTGDERVPVRSINLNEPPKILFPED